MLWAFAGTGDANDASFILTEFVYKETLSKLGYTFDACVIMDWEAQAFALIESELTRLKNEKDKRSLKSRNG